MLIKFNLMLKLEKRKIHKSHGKNQTSTFQNINYEFEEYGKPVCHSQRESHIAIQSIILRE